MTRSRKPPVRPLAHDAPDAEDLARFAFRTLVAGLPWCEVVALTATVISPGPIPQAGEYTFSAMSESYLRRHARGGGNVLARVDNIRRVGNDSLLAALRTWFRQQAAAREAQVDRAAGFQKAVDKAKRKLVRKGARS